MKSRLMDEAFASGSKAVISKLERWAAVLEEMNYYISNDVQRIALTLFLAEVLDTIATLDSKHN